LHGRISDKEGNKNLKVNGAKAGFGAARILNRECAQNGYKVGLRAGAEAASEGSAALFRYLSLAGKGLHISGSHSVLFFYRSTSTRWLLNPWSLMHLEKARKTKTKEQ